MEKEEIRTKDRIEERSYEGLKKLYEQEQEIIPENIKEQEKYIPEEE